MTNEIKTSKLARGIADLLWDDTPGLQDMCDKAFWRNMKAPLIDSKLKEIRGLAKKYHWICPQCCGEWDDFELPEILKLVEIDGE